MYADRVKELAPHIEEVKAEFARSEDVALLIDSLAAQKLNHFDARIVLYEGIGLSLREAKVRLYENEFYRRELDQEAELWDKWREALAQRGAEVTDDSISIRLDIEL